MFNSSSTLIRFRTSGEAPALGSCARALLATPADTNGIETIRIEHHRCKDDRPSRERRTLRQEQEFTAASTMSSTFREHTPDPIAWFG
jgi:hypothetical protein